VSFFIIYHQVLILYSALPVSPDNLFVIFAPITSVLDNTYELLTVVM